MGKHQERRRDGHQAGGPRWFHGGQPPACSFRKPFCLPEAPPAHAVSAARHSRFPWVVWLPWLARATVIARTHPSPPTQVFSDPNRPLAWTISACTLAARFSSRTWHPGIPYQPVLSLTTWGHALGPRAPGLTMTPTGQTLLTHVHTSTTLDLCADPRQVLSVLGSSGRPRWSSPLVASRTQGVSQQRSA
jgi:hypothetical protein